MTACLLTHDGVTRTISEWAEEPSVKALGITRRCIAHRVRNRWSALETLTVPQQAERPSVIEARRAAEEAAAKAPEGSPLILALEAELGRVERRMRAVLTVIEHAEQLDRERAA